MACDIIRGGYFEFGDLIMRMGGVLGWVCALNETDAVSDLSARNTLYKTRCKHD